MIDVTKSFYAAQKKPMSAVLIELSVRLVLVADDEDEEREAQHMILFSEKTDEQLLQFVQKLCGAKGVGFERSRDRSYHLYAYNGVAFDSISTVLHIAAEGCIEDVVV